MPASVAFVALLAGLAILPLANHGRVGAGPQVLPVRSSPEASVVLPRPTPVEDPGPTPCPVDPPTPMVTIRVRVPAFSAPGQEITYQICLENCSQAAAHHVLVRNPLPTNARLVRADPEPSVREPELVWRFGTLEACACKEITLVLAPTAPGDINNCARVQFEHGQCVRTRVSHGQLALRKTGPTQALLFDPIPFQLTVTNTGAADIADVVLTDTLPAGLEHANGKNVLTWEVGTLGAGQTRSVDYQVIAKKAERLCNQAVVTASGGLREEASHCVTIVESKLQMVMTGPEKRYLNRPALYQITVSNPGSAPASQVVIAASIPPGMTIAGASEGARQVEGQVQWPIGALAAGARRTVQLSLRAKEKGDVRLRAGATAARGLSAHAEAVTVFEGAAGLTVDVDDRDDPVETGKNSSYLITVINQGNVPATNVRITATVPEQMAVTDVKGPSNAGKDGNKVAFEPITIAAGATATFEVFVKPLRAGDVRFRVDLSADQLPAGPVRREESTTIYTDLPARPAPAPE